MKIRIRYCAAVGAAIAVVAASPAMAAHTGFTLTADGDSLVRFDPANTASTQVIMLSGDAARLDAVDFRPATGELVGYDSANNAYFVVNPTTGATRRIDDGMAAAVTQSNALDIDWNPTIDRMRLVTAADDNIVFNPENGATIAVTDLFFAAGDTNAAADPAIIGNAYTNSFAGATTTTQYVLDAETDSLGILANNTGVITTVSGLSFDGADYTFGENGGFDIFYNAGADANIAYAVLFGGDLTSLFLVDVMTGGLNKIGDFDAGLGQLKGLAFGVVSEVPLPAALPLFAAGLAGLGLAGRRKRRRDAVNSAAA